MSAGDPGDAPTAAELRGLYTAPVEGFVRERAALVGRLKQEGRPRAAAAAKALRRPSLSAWGTNQLAVRAADEVRRLLDSGRRLREAQLALAAGGAGRDAFAAASAEQRALVSALTERARELLGEAGHPATAATVERITRNLRAAATSDDAAAALAEGRLDRDLEPQDFSALLAAAATAPPPRPPARPAPEPAPPAQGGGDARVRGEAAPRPAAPAVRDDAKARADARAAEARARRAVKDAEAEVIGARRDLVRAEGERRDAEARLESARASVDRARERLASAEAALTAAVERQREAEERTS